MRSSKDRHELPLRDPLRDPDREPLVTRVSGDVYRHVFVLLVLRDEEVVAVAGSQRIAHRGGELHVRVVLWDGVLHCGMDNRPRFRLELIVA